MNLFDVAYEELSGLPGPTPSNRLDALCRRFPELSSSDVSAALERAYELKWKACALSDAIEKGQCDGDEIALLALRHEFPGFSEATRERALRDGRTINQW